MAFTTREPLIVRTAVVGVLTAVLHAAIVLGYLPITPEAEVAVASVIDVLGVTVATFWARSKVTPVVDYAAEHAAPSEK